MGNIIPKALGPAQAFIWSLYIWLLLLLVFLHVASQHSLGGSDCSGTWINLNMHVYVLFSKNIHWEEEEGYRRQNVDLT